MIKTHLGYLQCYIKWMNIAFHITEISVISFINLNDIEKTFRTFVCSTSGWIDVTDNTQGLSGRLFLWNLKHEWYINVHKRQKRL